MDGYTQGQLQEHQSTSHAFFSITRILFPSSFIFHEAVHICRGGCCKKGTVREDDDDEKKEHFKGMM